MLDYKQYCEIYKLTFTLAYIILTSKFGIRQTPNKSLNRNVIIRKLGVILANLSVGVRDGEEI